MSVLARIDPELLTAQGLVGDWSARELLAHLGHWADWATRVVDHAADGRLEDLVTGEWDVDAQNARVASEMAGRSMDEALDREAAAYDALLARLRVTDPALLAVVTPWGATVEGSVIENGPAHYDEHALQIRAWFGDASEPDEEDDEES
jgi:hypothetical protein